MLEDTYNMKINEYLPLRDIVFQTLRNAIIIGCLLIVIAITSGIIFRHDVSFIFAGIGIVIIGLAFLSYINRTN